MTAKDLSVIYHESSLEAEREDHLIEGTMRALERLPGIEAQARAAFDKCLNLLQGGGIRAGTAQRQWRKKIGQVRWKKLHQAHQDWAHKIPSGAFAEPYDVAAVMVRFGFATAYRDAAQKCWEWMDPDG